MTPLEPVLSLLLPRLPEAEGQAPSPEPARPQRGCTSPLRVLTLPEKASPRFLPPCCLVFADPAGAERRPSGSALGLGRSGQEDLK